MVVPYHGKNKLWLVGGTYPCNSSEYVDIGGSIPGPDIPISDPDDVIRCNEGVAMVAIADGISMIIGPGDVYTPSETYLFTYFDTWTPGPPLKKGRDGHAAGTLTDTMTKDIVVAVVGGHDGYNATLDSVEILYPEEHEWMEGITLIFTPFNLAI